jgi:hypothetical protein
MFEIPKILNSSNSAQLPTLLRRFPSSTHPRKRFLKVAPFRVACQRRVLSAKFWSQFRLCPSADVANGTGTDHVRCIRF